MPDAPTKEYSGPILFIIHAPKEYPLPFYTDAEKKALEANKKRIEQALSRAGKKGVPVLYEAGVEEEHAKRMVEKLKTPPRIIWAKWKDADNSSAIKRILQENKITPTKVMGLGIYRNICVIDRMKSIKTAYPEAKVILLEGVYTFFGSEKLNRRAAYRYALQQHGIERTKKLMARHLR